MKTRFTTLLAISIVGLMLNTNKIVAQKSAPDRERKSVVTFGYGQSLFARETVNLMYDYRVNKNLTVGLAASLRHSLHITEDLDIVPRSNGYDRLNISARILGHSGNFKPTDFYGGVRIGVTEGFNGAVYHPILPSLQLLSGVRFTIPHSGVGLNAELAFGTPYFAAAGISYAF